MNHIFLAALIFVVSAQPSPRRRSPPYDDRRRTFDDRRRTFDDRRRFAPSYDDRRRFAPSYDDRRRWSPADDRRRYTPPAPPPPPPCYVQHCALCLAPTLCARCGSGYTLNGSILGEECKACGSNCSRCETAGAGQCDPKGCLESHIFVNGTCKACSTSCESCESAGAGACDEGKCKYGFGNRRNATGCGACTGHCRNCSVSGAANCDAGQCDSKYTNNQSNCSQCAAMCVSCNAAGAGLCDSCERNHFVDKDKTCTRCPDFCEMCHDASHEGCTLCTSGYTFNGKHECVIEIDYASYIPIGIAIVAALIGVFFVVWNFRLRRASPTSGDGLLQQQMAVRSARTAALDRSQSLPNLPVQPIWSVPSGAWRGYYTYNGRNHDVCEFQLQFDNGAVQGRGVDDVGAYAINGQFDGRSHSIQFTKQYQRGTRNQAGFVSEDNEGHAVAYAGRLVGQNLGAGFRGSWCIRNRGTNSDGVFHLWPAMDSWAFASAPSLEEPTPQVFQVAEDGECVVCLDQAITTCLRPCGHIALCSQCADRLMRSTGTCPICRAPIQSVLTMQNGEVHPSAAQALRSY